MDEARSGLVLCGGRSSRMGTDKALLDLGSRTLLERAIACLAQLADPVLLACGERERYAEFGRPLCCDRFQGGGPLAGIEAGLAAAPKGLVCVLAVDMPRADKALMAELVQRACAEDLDACLLESELGPEPLCGVYHTRLLPFVRAALEAGQRKVISFLDVSIDGGRPRVRWVPERELRAGVSLNLNTPVELERERAALAEASRKVAS